jgi:signal transduction histidine kinase
LTDAPTPRTAAAAVVEACVGRLDAQRGGFYILDLSTGRYLPFVRPAGAEDIAVPVSRIEPGGLELGPLAEFLAAGDSPSPIADGCAVYVRRGRSCLGVLRLDGPAPGALTAVATDELLAAADLLGLVYANEFASNLLSKLQQPIDFNQPEAIFFEKVASLIQASSQMEFVALREYKDGRLKCIALAGFGREPDMRRWDFDPVDHYEDFAVALEGKTRVVDKLDPVRHRELMQQPWAKNVRSFVATPVKVGNDVFGVLSVAARCEFDYSMVEQRGFESIANAIGVSITNYRSSRRLAIRIDEYAELALAITGLEVARSVKHEALNYLSIANAGLRDLWVRLGKPKADADIHQIDSALSRLSTSLNVITQAPASPKPGEWRRVQLTEVWEQARAAVAGRLEEQRIDARPVAGDATVYARPEWLRQVFLNLLLNSIDAFRSAKKKGDRRIELTIDRQATRASEIVITFRDNAGGIAPHRLHVPRGAEELPIVQNVFQEGVTSKKEGSGFGLWLARHIMEDHRGSIDLTDYRSGVTFVIRMPKADEGEALLKERG